jgi:hypothetical protein
MTDVRAIAASRAISGAIAAVIPAMILPVVQVRRRVAPSPAAARSACANDTTRVRPAGGAR